MRKAYNSMDTAFNKHLVKINCALFVHEVERSAKPLYPDLLQVKNPGTNS